MTRGFWGYPIFWGPWTKVVRVSSHATIQAWATLQLVIYKLQCGIQHIIINKIISNNQQILVFLLRFSVALAQNTTGITTATAMAAAGRNGYIRTIYGTRQHRRHQQRHLNLL